MKIELKSIEKSFYLNKKKIKVIDNISLTLEPGICTALIGPSGCGKSTLLGIIANFYSPDRGLANVDGQVSVCMQKDMLLPWKDILSNVCLPVEIKDKSKLKEAQQKAISLLPLFGLEGFAHSYPSQLSGGMSQRAALLRTLMSEGDFWLMDEPFSSLDALTKSDLQIWLLSIFEKFKPGALLITHDIDEALLLADKICVLSPRPTKIIAELPSPKSQGLDQDSLTHVKMKTQIRDILHLGMHE